MPTAFSGLVREQARVPGRAEHGIIADWDRAPGDARRWSAAEGRPDN
jgi:hypothetical protein